MVICLKRGADLHMAQLMPLPLTVSCFSKIQIGFTFLLLAHPGSPGKRAVKWYVYQGNHLPLSIFSKLTCCGWLLSRVVSLLDSGSERPGSNRSQADCQEPGSAPEPYAR